MKEEEEMSLPQTKEDAFHAHTVATAGTEWTGGRMLTDGGAGGAGGANQDAFYANIWAEARTEYGGRPMFITKGGTGTAAVAAGTGANGTRGSDQNQGRRESEPTSNDTWGS